MMHDASELGQMHVVSISVILLPLQALNNPAHPVLMILGGMKYQTNLCILDRIIDRVDRVIVGGVLEPDFLSGNSEFAIPPLVSGFYWPPSH
jgi:hypothetical protein